MKTDVLECAKTEIQENVWKSGKIICLQKGKTRRKESGTTVKKGTQNDQKRGITVACTK